MFDFKEFRSINKLKQSDAAIYFGCAQAFISQIERGIGKMPESFISKIKSDGIYEIPMPKVQAEGDINVPREVFDKISQLIDTVCSQQETIKILVLKRQMSRRKTMQDVQMSTNRIRKL